MRYIIHGVIAFWINYITNGMKIYTESDKNMTLINCISEIVELLGQRKVSIEYSKSLEDVATAILTKTRIPTIVNSLESHMKEGMDKRTFDDIKIILNETEPERVLNTTLWNGDTRFIIFSEKQEPQTIFQKFWKRMVINVFVLVKENNNILIYNYEPFKGDDCKTVEVILVDKYSEKEFIYKGIVFKDQFRLKNVNGCSINVTVHDVKPDLVFEGENGGNTSSRIGGFEGKLMRVISKCLNFTALYKVAYDGISWGWIRPSPHGTVGEVYTGISEFALGMTGALLDRYETLDISQNYNIEECLTFAVPRGLGTKNAYWITIFVLEFTPVTWVLIVFSFLVICITLWSINKQLNLHWFHSKTEVIISVFSSCFGAPMNIPNVKSTRNIVSCWIIFCFIITVAYKASMGSKLAVPARDPDIDTYEQLLQLDIEINGFRTMCQLMTFQNWVYNTMRRKYKFVDYPGAYALTRVATLGTEAHLRHKTTLMYYIVLDPKLRGRIKILDECVIFYYPLIFLRKYSPFTNKVSQIIFRLEEFGILPFWRSKYEYKMSTEAKPFYKLSLSRMFGVYFVLLFGYLAAFIAFVSEISYNIYLRKKQRR